VPAVPPAATTPAADQSARLTFTTDSEEVRGLLGACLDALDNYRTEAAQKKCEAAVAKDSSSAVGYALLAQAATVKSVMQKRIGEAQDAMGKHFPSEGERLLVEAILAQLEDRRPAARAALDALVSTLPGERRAYYYRGLHRYRQGDFEGALGDYQKATTLDPKFGPAYNATGHLLLRREKLEEAQKAFEKYAEVQPKEANAQDSLAILHLRKNELGPAVDAARKALELDPRFLKANARLGDALLFQGNAQAARRAYGVLMASADPAEHHDGAMRTARSRLLETGLAPLAKSMQEAEKDYTAEAETAKRLQRKADQVRALLELGRVQLERAALAEAARTVQQLRELLEEHSDAAAMDASGDGKSDGKTDGKADAKVDAKAAADKEKAAPTLTADEQTRFAGEVLVLRALLLSAIGEREDAEERAVELEKLLRGPAGPQRARELRGDMAAREGERHVVVKQLEQSVRATAKFALALALSGGKPGEQIDVGHGRGLMEELGHRNVNDLETALTRGRARSWLKANPVKPEGKPEGAAPAKLEVKSDASPAAKEAKL
jgi:tetratricopeptide (TPR) repeat protein